MIGSEKFFQLCIFSVEIANHSLCLLSWNIVVNLEDAWNVPIK